MLRSSILLLALQLLALAAYPALETAPAAGAYRGGDGRRAGADPPAPLLPTPVTIQPNVDSIDFGEIVVGFHKDTVVRLLKSSQLLEVINLIGPTGRDGLAFLAPSGSSAMADSEQQRPITITFAPDGARPFQATYTIQGDSLNRTIWLTGRGITGPRLAVADTIDFGTVDRASTPPCPVRADTLFNDTVDSLISIVASVDLNDVRGVFSLLDSVRNRTISIAEFAAFRVQFCPPDTGTYQALLTVTTSAGSRQVVLRGRLTGSTTAGGGDSLALSSYDIDFGDVLVDSCRSIADTIYNPTDSLFTVMHSLLGGSLDFGATDSASLRPRTNAVILYTFCPTDTGARSDLDSVYDTGRTRGALVRLRGRGINGVLSMIDTVRFAVTAPGCQTMPLLLKNTGNVTIRVDTPSIGAPFELLAGSHFPILLNGGDTITLFLQFCDTITETVVLPTTFTYTVLAGSNPIRSAAVVLKGVASSQGPATVRPRVDQTSLNFGTVVTGRCKTDSISIINPGDQPVTISESSIISSGGAGPTSSFTIVRPATPSFIVPARDTVWVVIDFCPDTLLADTATWSGRSTDTIFTVALRGARPPVIASAGVRISLDSLTKAAVGTPFLVSVRVDPEPGETAGMAWDSVWISYNPRSFFPRRALSGGDPSLVTLVRTGSGTITVKRLGVRRNLTPGAIFELELMGLTTGEPRNTIRIDQAFFTGVPRTTLGGGGFVELSGCDLDGSISFNKAGGIRGITRPNGSGSLTLTLRAPEGATPRLSVVDLRGREVAASLLPPGTGADQQATIDLAGIAPGFYLIELRVGSDRSTTQIMITK